MAGPLPEARRLLVARSTLSPHKSAMPGNWQRRRTGLAAVAVAAAAMPPAWLEALAVARCTAAVVVAVAAALRACSVAPAADRCTEATAGQALAVTQPLQPRQELRVD